MSNFGSTSTEPDESEPGFIKVLFSTYSARLFLNHCSFQEKPLSFRESRFVGLSIAIRKSFNSSFLHWRNYRTAVREGDDVLDKFPLLLVFPDLRKNPVDLQAIVDGLLLPEEITRKLVGKKADFTHLKKSRQRKVMIKDSLRINLKLQ